jgi:hypothetical protein
MFYDVPAASFAVRDPEKNVKLRDGGKIARTPDLRVSHCCRAAVIKLSVVISTRR